MTKASRITKFGLKAIEYIFILLLGLIIVFFIFFVIKRDEISERIIQYTNNITEGELQFNRISISPFIQFPNISISMDSVEYYEYSFDTLETSPTPIAAFNKLYIAFDFQDLLQGKLSLSQVLIKEGTINLVRYTDTSLNFTNALRLIDNNDSKSLNDKREKIDSTTKYPVKLLLEKASIKNIIVDYKDIPNQIRSELIFEDATVQFNHKSDTLISEITANILISNHKIPNLIHIKNQKLSVKVSSLINRNKKWAIINPSIVKIGQSSLNINGLLKKKEEQKYVDIYFNSTDKNLNLINLILEEKAIQGFQTGNVNFRGQIKGFINHNIPNITCDYNITEVSIPIPETEKEISHLNVVGSFNSGIARNFSQAVLSIDTLYALLPDGFISGQIELENFFTPHIDYSINLKTNLREFDPILSIPGIDSLQGNIKLENKFRGYLSNKLKEVNREYSFVDISFDSVGFKMPSIANVQYLNGQISGNIDSLCFNNLETNIGNSDILLNGSIFNLSTLIINQNKTVLADLSINSNKFDLAKLLHFKPNIGTGFPYQISGLNFSVKATTSYNNFHNSPFVPIIKFQISKLDANIEKLMSPISIKQCEFILKDKDSTLHLDFNNLDLVLTHGKLTGDVDFYDPVTSEKYLAFNGQIFNVNVGKVFKKENKAISKLLDAKLNGAINCTLDFSPNKSKPFQQTNIKFKDFIYENITDTFNIELLQVNTGEVKWDILENKNPLATISSVINILVENLTSTIFNIDTLGYKISANHGEFIILPEHAHLFGKKGNGCYVISPFSLNPSYKVFYQVDNFQASKLLSSFKKDTIFTGNMDMELDISFSGRTKEEFLSTLNGKLLFQSAYSTIYGYDLDNVIKKISRTQRFSLVDLGATIIAGPVGLVLSKGSDYTRLLINNGESTQINGFKTEWDIVNGVAYANDVAFAAQENRIALKGNVDFNTEKLNITIALVDEIGCSILNQELSGDIEDPKAGDLVIINSILAPVTNLVEDVVAKCDSFYVGTINHPISNK